MSSPHEQHERALRQWLSEQFPGQGYDLDSFTIDIPGWAFFEITSEDEFSDFVMFRAVRDDGSVVDETSGESELAAILESIGLLDGAEVPTAAQLANVVLATMSVDRETLLHDADTTDGLNKITRGARLAAPKLEVGRSSAVLTFWTRWSARRILVWRHSVKVTKGYRVKVRAKQKKIRFK